jgi:hypothetical protein
MKLLNLTLSFLLLAIPFQLLTLNIGSRQPILSNNSLAQNTQLLTYTQPGKYSITYPPGWKINTGANHFVSLRNFPSVEAIRFSRQTPAQVQIIVMPKVTLSNPLRRASFELPHKVLCK